MYRIELSPGEVTVFRTIEELATGVRNGVISSRARIYHGATQKWLPIEFHPHYKAALALLSGDAPAVALPTPKPQERPSFEKLSFLQQPAVTSRASSATSEAVAEQAAGAAKVHAALEPAEAAGSEPEHIEPAGTAHTVEPPTLARPALPEPSTADSLSEPASSTLAPALSGPVATPVEASQHRPLPERREGREKSSQTDRRRAAAQARPELPYLVPPDDTDEPLTFDRGYDAPPPPARPRPASVIVRERPEPVIEEPALSPAAPGRGVPAAIAAIRASEAAAAEASGPAVVPADAPRSVGGASALPAVRTSPVADLPRIAYPEFTPADAPVAEPPSTGSRRRPLQVALALGLLAVGGYGATWVFGPGHQSASGAQRPERVEAAAAQPIPSVGGPAPVAGASIVTAMPAKTPTHSAARPTLPAAQDSMPPASSGFAPALEARAIVKPSTPGDSARGPAADSLPGVAPAPIDISVPVPVVLDDSLLPNDRRQGDSTLRKILRAVNGGKELPARP